MPITYYKIANTTLLSSSSTVTFSSIPTDYTDLVLRYSTRRNTGAGSSYAQDFLDFNNVGQTNQNMNETFNDSGGVGFLRGTSLPMWSNDAGSTTSTFSNGEIYIANYNSGNNKTSLSDCIVETNGTSCLLIVLAFLWSSTASINRIDCLAGSSNSFAANSTFSLYGIKNS